MGTPLFPLNAEFRGLGRLKLSPLPNCNVSFRCIRKKLLI